MAIQHCSDIAAHIISEEGLGVPGGTKEMFYLSLPSSDLWEAELENLMVPL